jgi:RNA polymerase sigma-70 factor (ECF subfamily)
LDFIDLELTLALLNYAATIVGSRASAEDIVQEACLRFAIARAEQGEQAPIVQPLAYLRKIVRNLAIDAAHRVSRERRLIVNSEHLDDTVAATPDPESAALTREALHTVKVALEELPYRMRRAFELHRLDHRTLSEITTELGISVTLAHQLVHRATTHCTESVSDADRRLEDHDTVLSRAPSR